MELTDEQLALKVQQGDDFAIEQLFKRYKPLLNKVCRSFFLFGADADDLMQEAMIGLYKACLSYKKEVANFNTFANICVKRKVLDAVKKSNSLKNKMISDSLPLNFDEDGLNDIASEKLNPDEKIIESENFNELKEKIFCKLSDFELLVLKYYLQGWSYNKIATKLNKTSKSVDNALARIKQKLQGLNN